MDVDKLFENPNIYFETIEQLSLRIAKIDEIISRQLDEILHHPEFKALEASWRGIYQLVRRKDSSRFVKIKIFQARKNDLVKDFERADSIEQTAIYTNVFFNVYQKGLDEPFGLLIGAFEFDHFPKDSTITNNMSEIAAKSHAPFVAGISPGLFYWESFEEIDDIRDIRRILSITQYNRWNEFRRTENARYVGLCMPHILIREPYRIEQKFVYRESNDKKDLLWGNAAFAFAACAVRSFEEKSWLGTLRGVDGKIEDFCFPFSANDDLNAIESLDANTSKFAAEISDFGFMSLLTADDGNPYFFDSQSLYKPNVFDDEAVTKFNRQCSQLEYVIAVARFGVNIKSFWQNNFQHFTSEEQLRNYLHKWLSRYHQNDDHAPDEVKARMPLREYYLMKKETYEKTDDYQYIAFIRPSYLLDDLMLPIRLEIHLPALKLF